MTSLDRRGEDLDALYEKCDWPSEFLRDPSSWLEADKMEQLLKQIHDDYDRDSFSGSGDRGGDAHREMNREINREINSETNGEVHGDNAEALLVAVGHQGKDLRCWGVLDSVLRMVQTPKDLFAQPERFLSYFISPAPPIGQLKRGADFVSFVLPVSEVQFPHVTSYLRAALEALPSYINKPMANVTWENSRVTISWSENELSLFSEAQSAEVSLHPALMRNILMNLETSQKELEETKRRLAMSEEECERLKTQVRSGTSIQNQKELEAILSPLNDLSSGSLELALSELYRLGDYMARGHQLITLLIGQGRQTPQVQEAMRRVDWARVAQEGPNVIKRAVRELQVMQDALKNLPQVPASGNPPSSAIGALPGVISSVAQPTLFSQNSL